ncbi:MAG TPA: sugar-binding protein [Sedimentisphaerales bacterium]|nr:sugar-binding protein [Sedimentisphaerales bacterium]
MLAKKCLFVGIFTLLSLGLAIADPPAVHPVTGEELVINCLRGTPDAIDGDLSDWNLEAMTPAVLDVAEQVFTGTWGGPEDCSGEFYMLWDDENIYMAVVVKDDTLSQNKTGGDIWNADAVEVFFATTNAVAPHAEHYQYGFDFTNQTWNWCNMDSGGQSAIDYLQVASVETADGYICEASIEYGQILALDWSVGSNIGFHPVIDDTDAADREIQITWTGREAHDQSLGFGYLVLSDASVTPGFSSSPSPSNGTLVEETWVTLSWRAGEFAVSHDVYLGDNFDDVNEATRDSDVFRINQDLNSTFYAAGFSGYAYPDGLVPGTTYYWRIDEVNEAEPNSPWKGKVWNFTIPPKTAYEPIPVDGAELVPENSTLTWTPGFGAKMHTVYIGEDFDTVNDASGGASIGLTSYTPDSLKLAKTYYWRVDEDDGGATYKGDVWSFTTEGAVTGPNPADGAVEVKPSVVLRWVAGAVADSHEVYFGADADAVKNATKASPEYKGAKALGEESYDPGMLTLNTAYYWRIDEANGTNPESPWAGNVWSFTTGDFFVIDDFEDYDTGENQIWFAWHDGLGAGAPGTPGYIPGNGTGSAVGDETTLSYTEETIVNGGLKSMPLAYDNNKQGFSKYSEVELALSAVRDWTQEGVTELSLWFRGYPAFVGSFAEGPLGTFTMTASGADIWAVDGVEADEFHFAYKMLTGPGSIVAKVESVDNTNAWAKAGVMIRETLNPDSAHATMVVTPASGVSFQRRPGTGQTSLDTTTTGITAPYWVKVDRDLSGNFTAYHSANGSAWTIQGTEIVPMSSNVHIGLALTSHDTALTCQAVFSNVTFTGTVGPQWASQDIGIASNAAEPLYVAISNTAGQPAVVVHDDPAAANIDTWTEWVIPLQTFADQGINLINVDRIAIGLGTQGNMTIPGGSGKTFFDDIRLYRPREAAGE